MKYFVVSDIHDHYSLMMEALKNNGFDINNSNHILIICGDAFYSGPEPGELFEFLKDLNEKKRLIFIYGNHDYELLNCLSNKTIGGRKGNRTCARLIVKYFTGKENLTDEELINECNKIGFVGFLKDVPIHYYETEHYVFVHGFIPTKNKTYMKNWRECSDLEFRGTTIKDGMLLSMYHGIREPNKTIVFGHYSAARCFLMHEASENDWKNKIYKDVSKVEKEGFYPFFGDGFIALDQSVKKTGFINCIVIEE